MPTMLKNVAVVKPGTFNTSIGEFTLTGEHLKKFYDNFGRGKPIVLKLGHTSVEHNERIALALGIEPDILKGEGARKAGAPKLGNVRNLYLDTNYLMRADIMLANDKVGKLFAEGYFDTFSIEADMETNTISALSALGAQHPAVNDLPRVNEANLAMVGEKLENPTIIFLAEESSNDDDDNDDDDDDSKDNKDKKNKKSEEDEDMKLHETLCKALKLDTDETDQEKLIAHITTISGNHTTQITEFAEHNKKVVTLESNVAALTKRLKISDYMTETVKLEDVPGTPLEFAEKLVEIELKMGEDMAKDYLLNLQERQKASTATKQLVGNGSSGNEGAGEEKTYKFEENVTKYAEAHKVNFEVAMGQYATMHPDEFADYWGSKEEEMAGKPHKPLIFLS